MTEKDIVLGEPIVGEDPGDEHTTTVRVLSSTKDMTAEEFARHCTTHLPHDKRCDYCNRARMPNVQHRRSPGGRKIPLLCADYGFLTMKSTDEVVPYLVCYVKPWRVIFATVVDMKGPDQHVIRRLAQFILDCGLTHFAYRSDREAAIRSMLSEAVKLAGVQGHLADPTDAAYSEDDIPAAVPK